MDVAALFVQSDGVYADREGVDPWPESRDARSYNGTLPVVAHPPCATWGRYAHKAGGKGNDGGCFAAALASVRLWGGVIEHPAGSAAWEHFGLPKPMEKADHFGGWSILVYQRWWGHQAIKPTWLYLVGIHCAHLPARPLGDVRPLEHMSKRERAATPPAFAAWLVNLAAKAKGRAEQWH